MKPFVYVIIACFVICVVVATIIHRNTVRNAVQHCNAEVTAKKRHEHRSVTHEGRVSYTFEAVFRTEIENLTFFVREETYNKLSVGQKGKLSFKDFLFLSFVVNSN